MSKIALTNLADLQNETTAVNAVNTNNTALTAALDNTLSRDGTSPNQMGASLDMNSHDIINLPTPVSSFSPARLMDIQSLGTGGSITVSPLPAGGTTGQSLSKNTSTNLDVSWKTIVPLAGASGQVLVKNTSADLDTSWKTINVPVVIPENFGYTTYGSGDAGPAIMSAIASVAGPVTVDLGQHNYNVVTPIVVNKNYVTIRGQGLSTFITFAPTANGSLFTFQFSNPAVIISGCVLKDMSLITADTTRTKVAIDLYDISTSEIANIAVYNQSTGFWGGGTGSIGIRTNGRDTTSFHDLYLAAELPLVLNKGVNSYLSTDHFHFYNCQLNAHAFPNVTVGNGAVLSNLTFDGYQAWALGTHGFYAGNDVSSVQSWYGVSFNNVRQEQGTDPTAYSYYITPNTGNHLDVAIWNNCDFDPNRKGLFARNINGVQLNNIFYPITAFGPTETINVDTSVDNLVLNNCNISTLATASYGGLNQVMVGPPGTGKSIQVPPNAWFSSALNSIVFRNGVETKALTLDGSTSGTTSIVPALVASGILTLPTATDTLVGKATTDVLTNKTLDSAGTGNVLKVSGVTISAGQYPGTAALNNATAGNVGEYVESVISSPVTVTTTGVAQNLTSISLTAGDWEVGCNIVYAPAATTSVSNTIASVSQTTNTLDQTNGRFSSNPTAAFVNGGLSITRVLPPVRFSLSGTTSIFAVGFATFTVAGITMTGIIHARRVR